MKEYDHLIVQKEIGKSSWFGFSLIIKPGSNKNRKDLLKLLNCIGFECRPIVAGNFTNSEVVKYFDSEISDDLPNANWIDKNGLFIGNHQNDMTEAIESLNLND